MPGFLVLGDNPVMRVINESSFLLWYLVAHIGNLGKTAIAMLLEYLFSKRGIFYSLSTPNGQAISVTVSAGATPMPVRL